MIAILVMAIVTVLGCPYPKYFIAFITVLISFTLQFGIWILRNRLKDKIGAAVTMVLICITFIFVLSTSFYLEVMGDDKVEQSIHIKRILEVFRVMTMIYATFLCIDFANFFVMIFAQLAS